MEYQRKGDQKNRPDLVAEREKRIAAAREEEQQRVKFRQEEEAKIEAERRVQEKKMDQTEALIAAIRAQVEKEKAQKEAASHKQANIVSPSKPTSSSEAKPQYRTISPEEMAKLEEKRRLKAAGIKVEENKPEPEETVEGAQGGLSGGFLGRVDDGPTLSNPLGNGPTLSDLNAGQQSLSDSSISGGGLGIDITATMSNGSNVSKADEKTIALNTKEINEALKKSGEEVQSVQVVDETSTIIVDDGSAWTNIQNSNDTTEEESVSWVDAGTVPTQVYAQDVANVSTSKTSFVDDNGDVISVVPVRQRPHASNDVQSVYNIDFDDDDDDDVMSFASNGDEISNEEARRRAEEEARRKAEEEARRKAEEEARRQAEEEAKRRAEEEARRRAEEEAKRRAEEEARRQAEEEARRRAEEEAKRKAEEEARRKAEEEAKRRAEEEARRKAEEEAKRRAEEEARRKAEEEARRKAEEEAKRQAEEEARRKAEEEAKRKAEEEARRKAEEEAKRQAEEEARRKAEEEAKRQAEEEARRQAEEEARRKAEEEARRKAEEEAKRQAEEEARRKAEEAKIAMQNGFSLPVGAEQFLGKYLSVTAINDQIANTMKYISENPNEPRNIVILGQYGFGTTTIAEDFARSFYAMGLCKTKTIAKIKAGALNRANISDAISKLRGGCLVVENAGVITNEKLDEIYQIVSAPNNDVVMIMTGQIETLSRIFKDNVVISTQFKHLIQMHRITDMDVFTIAKNHAIQLGYPCEQNAENNLRRKMQEVESGNLDRVLKIVDNAVSKAHNREMISGDQEHRLVPSDFE